MFEVLLERCELYITHFEKNIVARDDEVERLKAECQSTLYELKKCQDHLELKEEALTVQDERIIQLEDTVDKLKSRIQELSTFNKSRKMDMDIDVPNPIQEIRNHRQVIANSIAGIRLYFDQLRLLTNAHINNFFDTITQSLDATIRNVNTLQNNEDDQLNQIDGLQALLDDANVRIADLRNQLNNSRVEVLRTRRILEDALANETNTRRHWYDVAHQNQTRIGELLLGKLRLRMIVQEKENQIVKYRRNAY